MSRRASVLVQHAQGCDGKVALGWHAANRAARLMAERHGEPFVAYRCCRVRGRHSHVARDGWRTWKWSDRAVRP